MYYSLPRDQHGFTPLHYACSHGHVNIVESILGRGAKVDITNMGGDSPLHVATANGKYDIVLKVRDIPCENDDEKSHLCIMRMCSMKP